MDTDMQGPGSPRNQIPIRQGDQQQRTLISRNQIRSDQNFIMNQIVEEQESFEQNPDSVDYRRGPDLGGTRN